METMRALVYDRPSVCSVRDVPMPVCGEDEVVIKVMAASICKAQTAVIIQPVTSWDAIPSPPVMSSPAISTRWAPL